MWQEAQEITLGSVWRLTAALELRAQADRVTNHCFHTGLPIHQMIYRTRARPARQLQALVRPLAH